MEQEGKSSVAPNKTRVGSHVGQERQRAQRQEAVGGDQLDWYASVFGTRRRVTEALIMDTAGGGAGMMEALACHPLGT